MEIVKGFVELSGVETKQTAQQNHNNSNADATRKHTAREDSSGEYEKEEGQLR